MLDLIKFEYRKLWSGTAVVSLIALSVLTVLFAVVTLNLQYRTLDGDGNLTDGLAAFRTLKREAEDLEGVMDGEYLQELVRKYNLSYDKAYMEEHRGFLGTGGMTKYIVPNYVVNYAYYGPYMSNGNDKIGLDYDFLESEESFYRKYKEAVLEHLLYVNEINGLFPYSEEQIAVLEKKVQSIKTPFKIACHTGLAHLYVYFDMEYPVFFIALVFCLACLYARDSAGGVDELSLSSKNGRRKDMRARWIAGNLFALTAYLIYAGVLAVVHGAIASLHGADASAQTAWFECIHSFSVGMGVFLIFLGGLAGALVIAGIVMLLSVKIKNAKAAVAVGVVVVWLLGKGTATYSQLKLLNPRRFSGSELLTDFIFVGRTLVPYFAIVFLLGAVYTALLWLAVKRSYNGGVIKCLSLSISKEKES